MRERIVTGDLPPGSRIRETKLAVEFGVSRIPIREALQGLEHEGYLILTPRRGATVARPTPQQAMEVLTVRRALEGLAARQAADNRGGHLGKDLLRVVEAGNEALVHGEPDRLADLVDRFHALVAKASGNDELVEMLDALRYRMRWMFDVDTNHHSDCCLASLNAIVDAIVNGDADKAGDLMEQRLDQDSALYRLKPLA